MRVSHLVLMLGLLTAGVAQAQNNMEIKADFRAVPSLRHHLPINIPEARGFDRKSLDDLECLAWNLYFEARGGIVAEQIAIAWVPINRVSNPSFSRNICTNVFQYGWAGGRRQYQFSWAGIVRGPRWKREDVSWTKVQLIALKVYRKEIADTSGGATYFHNANLVPGWAPKSKKIKLGSHVFWRM